jgi:hypothetical protein
MFQSYDYIKYLGYDVETKQHSYQCKIIDSDFEEVGVAVVVDEIGVEVAVIDTYEKRNLNVAKNLMFAIVYGSKRWNYSIREIIQRNKQYNPKFAAYEKEMEKYLALM